ncbi:MAG: hypothetical protein ABI551_22740 [Polyangiaceae bacterium]
MKTIGLVVLLLSASALACGGSAPPPATPSTPAPAPTMTASAALPVDGLPTTSTSVVHFDDLGVSLDVPAGMRVMGDQELAARVRSASNPRLTASLEKRPPEKKGLPLLTLQKETLDPAQNVTVTLTVARVPPDTTPAELMASEREVIAQNMSSFKVLGDSKDITRDGVPGQEIDAEATSVQGSMSKKTRSVMRVYVRKGIAYSIVSGWPADAGLDRENEARSLVDGIRFYAPTPEE